MEHRLLAAVDRELDQNPILSRQSIDAVLSLISNPCTSDSTLTALLETLKLNLLNGNSNHQILLSLLSTLYHQHPRLRHRIDAAVHEVILLPSTPTSSLPQALSLLDPDGSESVHLFTNESIFFSLCFFQCVKTRRWMLRNVTKFRVRPLALLTVFLGFTKDPFPYIREAALDGLVMWNCSVGMEDRSWVECCYFRAVELLFDAEDSVRRSAVHAVGRWGQLLVALNPDKTKREFSDALFVQLCITVGDMDMETRIAAFNALGKIVTVSDDILLQTLSKKALAATKGKNYPGQYTAKVFKIPATAAAFTFVHGLEDEFYQVRRSACHALQMLTVLSAEFAGIIVHRLMDMLNDDSEVVRLQALQTLYHMAINNHLKMEDSHLDLFFGALIDSNALIRSAVRKTLQLTKLHKLAMFRSCIDNLMKSLEHYPQDEAAIFYALYKLGRMHGKFVISIIREVSQELEPSFHGKLNFDKARTAALLVLAISAPVSFERQISSIPPHIFSYAVTMLGRLSCGLVDVMGQDSLLAYLSYCSRLSFDCTSKNFEGEVLDLHVKDNYIHLSEKIVEISSFPELVEFQKVDPPLQSHVEATSCVEIVFQKVVNLWPLIKLGCTNEVQQTLRGWKEELRFFYRDSGQAAGFLFFALRYLHVIKLLGKSWACKFMRNMCFKDMRVLEILLGKMERRLKEMLCRYVGLSIEGELHILELLLVTYTLKLSYGDISCLQDYMKKMKFVLGRVEYLCKERSIELSHFVTELHNLSRGIVNSEDGVIQKLDILQNSLNLFSLRHIMLTADLKYLDAEVEVFDNDFQNPLPFISGLPVGIPLNITLHNISSETRLWVAINLGEKSTQFIFLDFSEFGGCNEARKFKFIAPFMRTPNVKHLLLKISIAMECLYEDQHLINHKGPKHDLIHLSEVKEVHLSVR